MPNFDLASAQPVGFDLASALPISENKSVMDNYQPLKIHNDITDGEPPLEAPMFSPDDIIGMGLPALAKGALLKGAMFAGVGKISSVGNGAFDLASAKIVNPTEFEIAHQLAHDNAILPREKGGLGLPEGNTAADRSAAMKEFSNTYYRGFDPAKPQGNYYASKPEEAFQNAPAMAKVLGPQTLQTSFDKTYGPKFTKDVIAHLKSQSDPQIQKIGQQLQDLTGGDAISHGEMFQFLNKSFGGANIGDEGALDIYNKVAGTKGFGGGGETLLHPSTPVRFTNAAFDPMQRKSLNPLAGVLVAPAGLGLAGNSDYGNNHQP